MKKLMIAMLGLSLLTGTVAVFAQENAPAKTEKTKKSKSTKEKKAKKTVEEKK